MMGRGCYRLLDPVVTEPGIVEICTTFTTRAAAMACAEQLVRARVAACVQVEGPIMSTYAWQGAIETAEEWRCTGKTTRGRRDACLTAIEQLHDYDTPQLIVTDVEASPAYAAWVRESVAMPRPPEGNG